MWVLDQSKNVPATRHFLYFNESGKSVIQQADRYSVIRNDK